MKANDTTHNPPIKVGDLLYAVGPGHNDPHTATDLLVYSTEVKAVPLKYSASGLPQFTIELDDDRPYLGFPK